MPTTLSAIPLIWTGIVDGAQGQRGLRLLTLMACARAVVLSPTSDPRTAALVEAPHTWVSELEAFMGPFTVEQRFVGFPHFFFLLRRCTFLLIYDGFNSTPYCSVNRLHWLQLT